MTRTREDARRQSVNEDCESTTRTRTTTRTTTRRMRLHALTPYIHTLTLARNTPLQHIERNRHERKARKQHLRRRHERERGERRAGVLPEEGWNKRQARNERRGRQLDAERHHEHGDDVTAEEVVEHEWWVCHECACSLPAQEHLREGTIETVCLFLFSRAQRLPAATRRATFAAYSSRIHSL